MYSLQMMFYRLGGDWLLTDMKRTHSMYDLDSSINLEVERGIEDDGSSLSGVSASLSWSIIPNAVC